MSLVAVCEAPSTFGHTCSARIEYRLHLCLTLSGLCFLRCEPPPIEYRRYSVNGSALRSLTPMALARELSHRRMALGMATAFPGSPGYVDRLHLSGHVTCSHV